MIIYLINLSRKVGWENGWRNGWWSLFKDCWQQLKIFKLYFFESRPFVNQCLPLMPRNGKKSLKWALSWFTFKKVCMVGFDFTQSILLFKQPKKCLTLMFYDTSSSFFRHYFLIFVSVSFFSFFLLFSLLFFSFFLSF